MEEPPPEIEEMEEPPPEIEDLPKLAEIKDLPKVAELPEPLLEDALISAGINEGCLRPLSLLSKRWLRATNLLRRSLQITITNARHLSRLLQRFPNIKHINLPFFLDPAQFFQEIFKFKISLESLDLTLMKSFPMKQLKVSNGVKFLQSSLKLLKLSYIEDQADTLGDLEVITHLFPNLEDLEFPWGYKITNIGVQMISSNLRKLTGISFAGCALITDLSLMSLADNCVGLRGIRLSHCSSISAAGITYLLNDNRNLISLGVQGTHDPGDHDPFETVKGLRRIELSRMEVSEDLLYSIARADIPLTELSLSECTNFSFQDVMVVLHEFNGTLEYFTLEDVSSLFPFNPMEGVDLLNLLKEFMNATTVKLNYCCRVSSTQLLHFICRCRRLNTLEVKGAHTDSEICILNMIFFKF